MWWPWLFSFVLFITWHLFVFFLFLVVWYFSIASLPPSLFLPSTFINIHGFSLPDPLLLQCHSLPLHYHLPSPLHVSKLEFTVNRSIGSTVPSGLGSNNYNKGPTMYRFSRPSFSFLFFLFLFFFLSFSWIVFIFFLLFCLLKCVPVLKFEYGADPLLVVSQDNYMQCNTTNPIQEFGGHKTIFELHWYGRYYFGEADHCLISGSEDDCACDGVPRPGFDEAVATPSFFSWCVLTRLEPVVRFGFWYGSGTVGSVTICSDNAVLLPILMLMPNMW